MGLGRAGLRCDSKKIKGLFCKMARAGRACALAAPSHMERPRRQEGRPKRGGARDVELSLRNPIILELYLYFVCCDAHADCFRCFKFLTN